MTWKATSTVKPLIISAFETIITKSIFNSNIWYQNVITNENHTSVWDTIDENYEQKSLFNYTHTVQQL